MAGKLQELWEAQLGATVLWAPVALTFGIWIYFALPEEPRLPVTGFFTLAAILLFWKARGRMGMLLLAILLSGFVLAKTRVEIIATPLLKATTGEIIVSGIVHDVARASERRATIILDRPAISLRNLALAALLILIMQPESAIQASFQMSFMAVMGLAEFFEYWNRPRAEQEYRIERRKIYYARKVYKITIAAILTTLAAGSFSSIPAAYHFGRLAPFGVLANGLAFPVASLVVMPFAVLSVLVMPLGHEAWPLAVLGKGLETVLSISNYVAALPGARRVIPQVPLGSAIALAFGASILCLASRQAKFAGGVFLIAGFALAQFNSFPDLLIERTAANTALRNGSGELVFANARRGRFAAEKWLQANGEEVAFKQAAARPGWTCEARACRTEIKGKVIAYFLDGEGVQPACRGLDIIIAAYPLRGVCKSVPTRIDRFDVWRLGSQAIVIEGGTTVITTARGLSGNRP